MLHEYNMDQLPKICVNFRNVYALVEKRLFALPFPSLCVLSSLHRPDGFTLNFVLGTTSVSMEVLPNLVKIGQEFRAIYMKPWVHFGADGNEKNYPRKLWCETVNTFIILTVSCNSKKKKHTKKALLSFNFNNGYVKAPHCYVIRTLSIPFWPKEWWKCYIYRVFQKEWPDFK